MGSQAGSASPALAQGWVRSISFLDYSELSAVCALHDGSIVAAGTFRGGHWDRAFIVRTDPQGRVSWIRSIGGGEYFEPTGGAVILAGNTREYPQSSALLLRIGENGELGDGCWPDLQAREGWSKEGTYEEGNPRLKRRSLEVVVTTPALKITVPSPILGHACAQPDLTGRWLQIGVTGQVLSATLSVLNIGGSQSRGCKTWIYVSQDAVLSSDDRLIDVRRVWWLENGGEFTLTTTYSSSDDLRGRYVIAVVDALNAVVEGDETDNTVPGQVPLESDLPGATHVNPLAPPI